MLWSAGACGWRVKGGPCLRRHVCQRTPRAVWRQYLRSSIDAQVGPTAVQMRHLADHPVQHADIAIVGGSVVGCATAWHLAKLQPSLNIVVIERDTSYARASAPLSAGGIRQQFSLPENIQLSLRSISFLKHLQQEAAHTGLSIAPADVDIAFRPNGYSFLASTTEGASTLERNVALQHELGASWIELLSPEQLKERLPWCRTDDLKLATLSSRNEGFFDPWRFLTVLRHMCKGLGVQFLHGEVAPLSFSRSSGGASYIADELLVHRDKARSKNCTSSPSSSSGQHDARCVRAGSIVLAAGAFSGTLLPSFVGQAVPVEPRKRTIVAFQHDSRGKEASAAPLPSAPLVVDPSGVYFRPEVAAGSFISGASPPAAEDFPSTTPADLDSPADDMFDDRLWPALYHRVPGAFDAIKATGSWAGFYDYNTQDQNGRHPDVGNLFINTGFSGHGLQQAPAAGEAVAEALLYGEFKTLDLQRLAPDRFHRRELILEDNIV